MTMQDGRNATRPYRVRAGGSWYWVDPTGAIEPGDMAVIYPAEGAATLAIFQSADGDTLTFSSPEGERFELAARDTVLHLAAVDEEQGRAT